MTWDRGPSQDPGPAWQQAMPGPFHFAEDGMTDVVGSASSNRRGSERAGSQLTLFSDPNAHLLNPDPEVSSPPSTSFSKFILTAARRRSVQTPVSVGPN